MFDVTPMVLVLDVLACWRLTRLVTSDSFPPVRAVREWVVAHSHGKTRPVRDAQGVHVADATLPGFFGELVECPFCASVWLAAGVLAAHWLAPDVWHPVAFVLALSSLAGPLVAYEPDLMAGTARTVWVLVDGDYDGAVWVHAAFTTEAAAEATRAHAGYGEVRRVEVHDEPIMSDVIWQAQIVSRLGPVASTQRIVMFPWEDAREDQVGPAYPGDYGVLVYDLTEDAARSKAKAVHDQLIADGLVDRRYAELHT